MSFTVHQILASIADDEERFTTILSPPEGKSRWTPDEANRRVGRQVVKPVTPQEKVSAIHTLAQDEEVAAAVTGDLLRRPAVVAQVKDRAKVRAVEELTREDQVAAAVAPDFLRRPAVVARVAKADKVKAVQELTRDEHVAAEVTTGLLRRPDVAFRAMSDDTARHQVERGRQAREHFEESGPVAPAIRNIDRSVEFLDLVTACHAFVAASGRVVPGLRDRQLGDDERTIVHENVARVGRRWTGSRPRWTPAGSTSTANWPACCKASRRCPAPPSADHPPPSDTPTPFGSYSSKPARPVWPSPNWSDPANCRPTRPARVWPACGTPSPNAAGRR
ncbi:DUF6192 family protein [Streptomyces sp. NBC_01497]|uniref:DUF6192 family protein n=1 Tax=Streptomyces sp. NBC_01497 TaxID=2903885 RepID=UPI003FCC7D05